MANVKVSILMPVRNAMAYLPECLRSIQNQSLKNWELIAIDDFSDDESYRWLCDQSSGDNRILVYRNNSKGIPAALKLALDRSNGKYITRMDSDDEMDRDKLAAMTEILDRNPRNRLVVCGFRYVTEKNIQQGFKQYEKWLNQVIRKGNFSGEIFRECTIPSSCWMMRKNDLRKLGLMDDLEVPEDYDLCFRIIKNGINAVSIPQQLHLWRDHPERTSRVNELYDIRKFGRFKIRWFIDLKLREQHTLVLWGCGRKGKDLARYLIEVDRPFHWVSGNQQRINREIYKCRIKSFGEINPTDSIRIILAVSSPRDQREIELKLKKIGFRRGEEYFPFF